MKSQTYYTLVYDFNKNILPYFKDMKLEDITSKNILEWEDYILTLNFSNNFNKNLYYLLSGFFEYCKNFYGFNKSIISNVGCFKEKYEEDKRDFYNYDEFKLFIKNLDHEVYKQFFCLMFFTGVRPGEAMALTFKDLNNGYISINKTISTHGKREIGTPKTKSSIRKIAIDSKLEKDLLNLKDYYKKNCLSVSTNSFIFGCNKPLSSSTINRYKKIACNKANLRSITLHQFRHSHATLLLDKGIIINEISRRLGHSKVSTTLDIYTHTDLSQEKRVLNTLNSMRIGSSNKLRLLLDNIFSILKH